MIWKKSEYLFVMNICWRRW